MKTCATCELDKSKSEFYKRSQSPDGLHYHCKDCSRIKRNSYNNDKVSKDPEFFRKYTILRTAKLAGISLDEFYEVLKNQDGKCKICNKTSSKNLCIDHCHVTGKFRGLLCRNCNTLLGHAKDSVEILQSAISYLRQF
jgi:Recombination endonuclease VII